jgi:hypothetical protein
MARNNIVFAFSNSLRAVTWESGTGCMVFSKRARLLRIARFEGATVQLVCKSYFNAAEAADDLETLIAVGHSPSNITLAMSRREGRYARHDRQEGLRTPRPIANVLLKMPHWRTTLRQTLRQQGVTTCEAQGLVVIVCGALAVRFPVLDGVGSAGLLDVLLGGGVRRRKAERLMLDLLRGGIVAAVSVNEAASEITRRIIGDSDE